MSGYTDNRGTLRDTPEVRPRYKPTGPGLSYNTDEPAYEKPDRDLSMSQSDPSAPSSPGRGVTTTGSTTVVAALYTPDQVQEVLDAALDLALTQLNPLVFEAITLEIAPDVFAELAKVRANDLLETCVHRVVSRGLPGIEPYDLLTLAPLGVVTFLDSFMNMNRGRVYRLESELREAYETYLTTKMNAQ